MFFDKFEKRKKPTQHKQAVKVEDAVKMSRRKFLKNTGLLIAGTLVGEKGGIKLLKKIASIPTQDTSQNVKTAENKNISTNKVVKETQPTVKREASSEITKEGSPLDAYSFLNGEPQPVSVSTGALVGDTFSDLYATYLGIADGTTVPETLDVDFKENLSSLWREKFNIQKRSPNEHSTQKQLLFLKEHHNLMNLAEYMYRSYDVKESDKMTLDVYRQNVSKSVDKSYAVFDDVFSHTFRTGSEQEVFSQEQLSVMSKMSKSLTADTLVSLSFTELMSSNNGNINSQVFDFLLRNAGVDFIDRIPSVHDMLESFGPYQITPNALAPQSAGSWAVKVLNVLPDGFMPGNVDGLLQDKEHTTAYTLAMLNIVQFVGTRNSSQLKYLSEVMDVLSPSQRERAILSFVASAHHRPKEAYDSFDAFIWSMHVERAHAFSDEKILTHIAGDLRIYTKKALANHKFLIGDTV